MSRTSATILFALGLAVACGLGYLLGLYAPPVALLPLEALFFTFLVACFLFNRDDHTPPLFLPLASVTFAAWIAQADRFNMLFLGEISVAGLVASYALAVIFYLRYKHLRLKQATSYGETP